MTHLSIILAGIVLLAGGVFSTAGAQENPATGPVRTVIQGTVRDTVSGEPVPFAIVRAVEPDSTTLTDRRGQFRLVVTPGTFTLDVRKIGYSVTATTVEVREGGLELDLSMTPLPVLLEAIVVTGENPALRIIRQAIARKNDVLARIHDYRYDAYVKLVVRDRDKDPDSTDAVVVITETQTTAFWAQPDRYQEVITARRQSSNVAAENNLVSVGQIVNFNADRIDLGTYSVVSPTADDALEHYDYHLLDTLQVEGRSVFRLAIEPRSESAPLFVGIIDIADSTYDVLAIDVGANEAIRFDFIENVRYGQRMADYGDGNWMPYEIRFAAEVNLGVPLPGIPRHMTIQHVAALSDYRFDTGELPATLGEYLVVVDRGADDADSASWEAARTIPLATSETDAYVRIDSIENVPASFGSRLGTGFAGLLFASSQPDFFHYNRVEGAYLGAGWTFRDISPDLIVRTKLGHAFGSDDWQYRAGARVRVSERRRIWIGASYHDETVPRPSVLSGGYNPTHLALSGKIDPQEYFDERGFTASLSAKLLNFTRLDIGYRDVSQRSVLASTDYAIFSDRAAEPNLPIVDGRLRTVTGVLSYDSRPLLKSKGRDFRFQQLAFTTVSIGAEVASPDLIASDFDFARFTLRLRHRQRSFNWGVTSFDAYAGVSTGTLPPQRYFMVDFGPRGFFNADGFNTLVEERFAGDRVAELGISHDFDRLLFGRSGIPLIRDIPFTFSVHGRVFWTDFADGAPAPGNLLLRTAPTAYTEIGFGLANLTPMLAPFNFGVYFTWQLSSYPTEGFQLRLGIPGF